MDQNSSNVGATFASDTEQRQLVRLLACCRWPGEAIGAELGITVDDLHQHFAEELAAGPATVQREILEAMHRAALAGNVDAAKVLLLMMSEDRDAKGCI